MFVIGAVASAGFSAACSHDHGRGSPSPTPTASGTPPGFPSTADSISVSTGPGRSDPEGVGSPSPSVTLVNWKDSRGADRTMTLWAWLYQYDFSFLGGQPDPAQVTARSSNDDAYGHPGFGYVVSHNSTNGNSPLGKADAPTSVTTTVFTGAHHAIHRIELLYDRDKEGGGDGIRIPVVIDWFVATGRDHPVWAVTWKTGQAANPNAIDFDTYRMDTRGPYGALNFDGAPTPDAGDAIGGVAWGDFGLRFATTDAQLTLNSPWTWNTPGDVAFTRAWTASVNAEMGIVQTRPGDKEMGYQDRVYGRERGVTSADAYTDKGDCTGLGDNRVYTVPCVAGWPYQLMNYDWDPTAGKPAGEATGTKLIAWGTPYGWLGASSFDLFDYSATADGRGDRSYATFLVLGPKCRYTAGGACDQPGDVENTISAVDALAAAAITSVGPGSLMTQAPKGPGAAETKMLSNGYDDTYAVYELQASGGAVAFTFTPAPGKPVDRPIFVVHGYSGTALPAISVGGTPRTVNTGDASSGAFVSLDTTTGTLWVTLNESLSTASPISIAAP